VEIFNYQLPIQNSTTKTRSYPEMVGDMSRVTLNSDLSKIPFVHFLPGSRPILTPKTKHVLLLVLIWEWLQTTSTPDATVQRLWATYRQLPMI